MRRRWVPHRHGIGWRARFKGRRTRRRAEGLADGIEGIGVIDNLFVGIAILAGVVLIVVLGWPLILLALDLLWLVAVLAIGVVARVLFRRPWRVEAVDATGNRLTWDVVGFRAAGRKRDEIAAIASSGLDPALAAPDRRVPAP